MQGYMRVFKAFVVAIRATIIPVKVYLFIR